MPFDIDAPVIEVSDKDFALFYRDLTEEMKKYKGKTVKFRAMAATDPKFPSGTCAIGRHIMTCCADDVAFCGLVSKVKDLSAVENSQWYIVTAEIDVRFSRMYGKKGPIYNVIKMEKTDAPEDLVATFY